MNWKTSVTALVLVASAASNAFADRKTDVLQQIDADSAHAAAMESRDLRDAGHEREIAEGCLERVQIAVDEGVKPTDEVPSREGVPGARKKGNNYYAPLKALETVCRNLHRRALTEELAWDLRDPLAAYERYSKPDASDEAGALFADSAADACRKALDGAVKHGASETDTFAINKKDWTIADLRAQVCDKLPALGKQARERFDTAKDASTKSEMEEYLAPFKKAGISGDKLKLVADEKDSDYLRKKGGYIIETPKEIAKASLICIQGEADDGYYIHILTFKGNKLVSDKLKDGFSKKEKALDACK